MRVELRQRWRQLWRQAPRRLQVKPAGHLVVFLAIALGVGAITSNHNGLFFAWGLVLGAMVVSGGVSELGLRHLKVGATLASGMRVGRPTQLTITLVNASSWWAAWGLGGVVRLDEGASTVQRPHLPFIVRLPPRQQIAVTVGWTPQRRGEVRVVSVTLKTSFPFGFFTKSRRLLAEAEPKLIWPEAVAIKTAENLLSAQLGDRTSLKAGTGEDFHSLRAWRDGDDVRRVVWRRMARTRRMVVIDHQAAASREVMVSAAWLRDAPEQLVERTIALLAGLLESFVARGMRVGLESHSIWCPPEKVDGQGGHHRIVLLDALARLEVGETPPRPTSKPHQGRVTLTGDGMEAASAGSIALDWSELRVAPSLAHGNHS